jgi:hypothetical protein
VGQCRQTHCECCHAVTGRPEFKYCACFAWTPHMTELWGLPRDERTGGLCRGCYDRAAEGEVRYTVATVPGVEGQLPRVGTMGADHGRCRNRSCICCAPVGPAGCAQAMGDRQCRQWVHAIGQVYCEECTTAEEWIERAIVSSRTEPLGEPRRGYRDAYEPTTWIVDVVPDGILPGEERLPRNIPQVRAGRPRVAVRAAAEEAKAPEEQGVAEIERPGSAMSTQEATAEGGAASADAQAGDGKDDSEQAQEDAPSPADSDEMS